MRKATTFFLLIVSLGLIFGGAASAQEEPTVNVTVIDESGDPVVVANPGDEVAADVLASANDEELVDSFVDVTVDPETGLQFEPDDAMMTTSDLGTWISNTDPILGGFFFFDDITDQWVWDIGSVDDIDPGDFAELIAPAIVSDTGDITVITDLWNNEGTEQDPFFELESTDSYTFLSVEPQPQPVVNATTVPMKTTGSPLALAMLAILSIIGGSVYGKLR